MSEERFDRLEAKIDALTESHKELAGSHKELMVSHKELATSQKQVVDMMAQLMQIVGETNRKVFDIADGQQQLHKEVLRISKTTELHKRKLADLEEQVNLLQPVDS